MQTHNVNTASKYRWLKMHTKLPVRKWSNEIESYKMMLHVHTCCLSTCCILKVCKLLGTLFRWRDVQRLFFICVKIAWITRTFRLGQKWCFDLHRYKTSISPHDELTTCSIHVTIKLTTVRMTRANSRMFSISKQFCQCSGTVAGHR